jgi:hypothetical protein
MGAGESIVSACRASGFVLYTNAPVTPSKTSVMAIGSNAVPSLVRVARNPVEGNRYPTSQNRTRTEPHRSESRSCERHVLYNSPTELASREVSGHCASCGYLGGAHGSSSRQKRRSGYGDGGLLEIRASSPENVRIVRGIKYRAFISYKHAEGLPLAERVAKALRTYAHLF